MGLMDILNGMQNGPRGPKTPGQGGMSPITMAILGLLAYKAYGKLTSGSGQPHPAPGPAPTPTQVGAGGVPADEANSGLGGLLGSLFGGGATPTSGNAGGIPGGLGGLGGALGGLLAGGAAGSLLNGGLKDVLDSLQQNGHGDVAKSWVSSGPNQQISPSDLGKALGDDTVSSLAEQAGLSKLELLDGLSQQLPHFVDQVTPNGRVPTDHEMQQMV
jgi:uncharacterized protein YidB (DUF937 family)